VARPSLGDGGSINTTIRLTARRRAELEAEAKQRGITLSALIREKLEAEEQQQPQRRPK
jgi:hypothetical protein